jgi:isopentenyl diphosphate isomerase/L-lactate dehydrogenase-like FMN-dependent dehydrogenase
MLKGTDVAVMRHGDAVFAVGGTGGFRTPDEMAKALAMGADAVALAPRSPPSAS